MNKMRKMERFGLCWHCEVSTMASWWGSKIYVRWNAELKRRHVRQEWNWKVGLEKDHKLLNHLGEASCAVYGNEWEVSVTCSVRGHPHF